jgi:hypothetical protein
MICTTLLYSAACIAETVREDRKTDAFSRINAGDGIDVYYTQSDSYSLAVEADKDYVGKIITKVEGETLVVKLENGIKTSVRKILRNRVIKVHVSAPVLDRVGVYGGSDFYADKLTCDKSFQLEAAGGADAKISSLTVTGDASISASGGADADIVSMIVAGNADISASGGADCDIKKLHAVECKLSSSGGSDLDISLELSGNLKANASGGADINISGKANEVSVSASGGSDINIRKLECKSADIHKSGGSDVHR